MKISSPSKKPFTRLPSFCLCICFFLQATSRPTCHMRSRPASRRLQRLTTWKASIGSTDTTEATGIHRPATTRFGSNRPPVGQPNPCRQALPPATNKSSTSRAPIPPQLPLEKPGKCPHQPNLLYHSGELIPDKRMIINTKTAAEKEGVVVTDAHLHQTHFPTPVNISQPEPCSLCRHHRGHECNITPEMQLTVISTPKY